MVIPTGTKGPPHVARPGGQPGLKAAEKPELKEGPFSPGLVLPVGKPELKGFSNREQKALLHQ